MPIPKSNLQPQIRPPQVATGRALDLTPDATRMVNELAKRGEIIAQGVKGPMEIAKAYDAYKVQEQKRQDTIDGFDALNEYAKKLGDRNAEIANWGPDEFILPSKTNPKINQQQQYIDDVNEYYTTFMDKANQIKDPGIRANLLQNAHRINLSNRQNFTKTIDEAQRVRIQNSANGANESIMAASLSNLPSVAAYGNDSLAPSYNNAIETAAMDTMLQINQNVQKAYNAQGIYNGPLIDAAARQKNEEYMDLLINQINSSNTSNAPWQESAPGKEIVKRMQALNLVSDKYAYKQLNRMEGEDVAVEVLMRPEQFVGKDGKFIQSMRNKVAPHMTHYEYDRIVKNAEEAAGNISTAKEARLAKALMDEVDATELNWQYNTGFFSKNNLKALMEVTGTDEKTFWETDIGKSLKAKQEKTLKESPYILLEHARDLADIMDKPYLIDTSTGEIVQKDLEGAALTLAENKVKENPSLAIRRPLQNNTQLEAMIKGYQKMGALAMASFDPRTTAVMGRSWNQAGRPPVKAIVYNRIWSTFNNASKYTGEVPITLVSDLFRETVDELQRGIKIKGEGEVNTAQLERKLHLDANLPIKDTNAINLIDEAIQVVAARNLSANTYQEIFQKAINYQNEAHARWSTDTDWQNEPGLGWHNLNPVELVNPNNMYFDEFAEEPRKQGLPLPVGPVLVQPRRLASDAWHDIKKLFGEGPQMTYNEQEIMESLFAPEFKYIKNPMFQKYEGTVKKSQEN